MISATVVVLIVPLVPVCYLQPSLHKQAFAVVVVDAHTSVWIFLVASPVHYIMLGCHQLLSDYSLSSDCESMNQQNFWSNSQLFLAVAKLSFFVPGITINIELLVKSLRVLW